MRLLRAKKGELCRKRPLPNVLNFLLLCLCPSFFVPYFYFSVYFSILAFSSLFALFLIAFPFALFCSSAKPLLNPRTIAGFSLYKKAPGKSRELPKYPLSPRNFRTAAGITFSRKEQTEIVGRHGAPAVAQAARPAEGGRASAFFIPQFLIGNRLSFCFYAAWLQLPAPVCLKLSLSTVTETAAPVW